LANVSALVVLLGHDFIVRGLLRALDNAGDESYLLIGKPIRYHPDLKEQSRYGIDLGL